MRLAIAYWRAGKPHMARDQLAVLSVLTPGGADVVVLGKKFKLEAEGAHLQ